MATRHRLWRHAGVAFLLLLAAFAPSIAIDAPPAEAVPGELSQSLPIDDFGEMVVDHANGHVFVSSPTSNAIVVLDFDGTIVKTIAGEAGAWGMVIDGGTLYVALSNSGAIDRIDTTTLERTSHLATGIVNPRTMVKVGGNLWVAAGTCSQHIAKLVKVSLSTGNKTTYNAENSYCPFVTADPAVPNTLLTSDWGLSPATIRRIDVSTGAPVTVVSKFENELGNLKQLAIDPDGTTFYAASGAPYLIGQYFMSDLSLTGTKYVTNPYPTAVAVTAANGGLLAGGMAGYYNPDVMVFDLRSPFTMRRSVDFGTTSRLLEDRALAFAEDGSRLFAIDAEMTMHVLLMPGVSGKVTNAAGDPFAGATVEAVAPDGSILGTTTTDSTGRYAIARTVFGDGGTYRLRFTGVGSSYVTWWGTGGQPANEGAASTLTFDPGVGTQADLVLLEPGSASGTVTNGHGQPLAGLEVTATSGPSGFEAASTTTGPDGSFEFHELVPGSYAFAIDDPAWEASGHSGGYIPQWFGEPGRIRDAAGTAYVVNPETVTALGSHRLATYWCDPTRFVSGAALGGADLSACDLTGASLAGATLTDAEFAHASLESADLRGAELAGADFESATLLLATTTNADFGAASWADTTCPDGVNSDDVGGTCFGHLGRPIANDGSPLGVVTEVEAVGGQVTVAGWALDPDTTSPIEVSVTVDGVAVASDLADQPDAHVNATYPLFGTDHGFSVDAGALEPGVHRVCAVAHNLYLGSDTQIGCDVADIDLNATTFHPLPPARVLDTRTGLGADKARLEAGQSIDVKVTGVGGVPSDHVGAVVLNVTVTNGTASSYATVWPTATARPVASNLNFKPGQTSPNLVLARVGADGSVSIYNNAGSVDVIADVSGYFDDGTTPDGARYHPVAPSRVLDTRDGTGGVVGPIPAGGIAHVQVVGHGDVPFSHVSSVVLNVTATNPTASSYLTLWPSDQTRPVASNLNYKPGQTVPNLVIAKVSSDGWVSIYNNSGTVDVVADIQGWFDDGTLYDGAAYYPMNPARILDTRVGIGGAAQPIGPGSARFLEVAKAGQRPPSGAVAVVMNTTVTMPTSSSYLTLWPASHDRPLASNLNFKPGQTIPNLVISTLDDDGWVGIFNSAGTVEVVGDVSGWFGEP